MSCLARSPKPGRKVAGRSDSPRKHERASSETPGGDRRECSGIQWVPTCDVRLARAEEAFLRPISHRLEQSKVAGINTVTLKAGAFVPQDRRRSTSPLSAAAGITASAEAAGDAAPAAEQAGSRRASGDRWAESRHVVCVHGFGGGLGMFLPNLRYLADALDAADGAGPPTVVHAIDLPGFARSDRVWRADGQPVGGDEAAGDCFSAIPPVATSGSPAPAKKAALGENPAAVATNTAEAMDFLTAALMRWADEMGARRLWLCGHSFGAFVAAHTAMRYPTRVSHLFFADPYGVSEKPADFEKHVPAPFRLIAGLVEKMPSILSPLRFVGPLGPTLFRRIRGDFAARWQPHVEDPDVFFKYVYHCNADGNASGEALFKACSGSFGFAAEPLLHSVPAGLPGHIGVTLAYGELTWMDRGAGYQLSTQLREKRGLTKLPTSVVSAGPQEGLTAAVVVESDGTAGVTYHTVSDAGHQINSDNADEFNAVLGEALGLPLPAALEGHGDIPSMGGAALAARNGGGRAAVRKRLAAAMNNSSETAPA